MFGMEYLDSYKRRHSNLDVASLFVALVLVVALALIVGETKEEVRRVVATCVDPQ